MRNPTNGDDVRTHVHVVYPVAADGPSIVAEVVLDGRVPNLRAEEPRTFQPHLNKHQSLCTFSANLQLIEEQSEVKNLSKLLGQRLLPLQRRAGEGGGVERVRELRQQPLQNLL